MAATVMGRSVGRTGYGLLGLTWRSVIPPEEQAFAAMRAAIQSSSTLWNGGDFYGTPQYNSLTLLKSYFKKYPEDAGKITLNIKSGMRSGLKVDGSPAYLRECVENSLHQLDGACKIDMFEMARRDKDTPLKESLGALAEMVAEGKIGGVALSEVNAETIREAAAITKIVAVEVELSLWSTEALTNGVAEACAELEIPIIAYSPIGRGVLTGQIKSYNDIPEGDIRRQLPRFQPENFPINLKLVRELEKIAAEKQCTPAQLALSWVRSISFRPGMPTVIPIPGATDPEKVRENAVEVELTKSDLEEIERILGEFEVKGERYHQYGMELADG